MNSAGRGGARPISTISRPSSKSCGVMLLLSPQRTQKAALGRQRDDRGSLPSIRLERSITAMPPSIVPMEEKLSYNIAHGRTASGGFDMGNTE